MISYYHTLSCNPLSILTSTLEKLDQDADDNNDYNNNDDNDDDDDDVNYTTLHYQKSFSV